MPRAKSLDDLKPGMRATLTRTVEFHRTLTYYQSHLPAILTTPSMIGQMEVVAAMVMRPRQPGHLLSLGTHINVSHRGAVRLGEKLRTVARFKKKYKPRDGRSARWVFEVEAWVGRRLIGEGTVERAVIPRPANAYKPGQKPSAEKREKQRGKKSAKKKNAKRKKRR